MKKHQWPCSGLSANSLLCSPFATSKDIYPASQRFITSFHCEFAFCYRRLRISSALEWWIEDSQLSKLAIDLLSIPAMSARIETFSEPRGATHFQTLPHSRQPVYTFLFTVLQCKESYLFTLLCWPTRKCSQTE